MILPVTAQPILLAFWSPGPAEMMVIAVIALLLYGGNLPEVARSWGKTLSELRRNLSGIHSDINDAIYRPEQLGYYPEQSAPYSDDTVDAYQVDETATSDAATDIVQTDAVQADTVAADDDTSVEATATDDEPNSEKRSATETD